ncbi:MAG TPA: PAS domain-containing protein [Opitutaceae bacterium]|nr:PAS domain-containing protein [Opitutaceae bacterium]
MSDVPSSARQSAEARPSLDSAILSLLMEAIPDRIYFKDLESRFVRNNAAHARAFGATPQDCVGKTDFDFFSREHAERALADERQIIRTGQPVIGKAERLTHRDGKQGWASTTKLPWRDASGNIIGTFGLTRDITATKEAEEKLTEERNLLRTIIDQLPSRLYVKDTASRFVLNNQAHLETLGAKSQEEVAGRTTLDFFPGERGRQALADDRRVLETGTAIHNEERSDFGSADGAVHWSLITKVPFYDSHGQLAGLVGISHDITERKRQEQAAKRNAEELARSNAELEQFAYVASHDLQEPLRAVASCVQLLKKRYGDQLDARADEFIAHAVDGTKRMQALITDLLAYSRVGTHTHPFAPAECGAVLDEALANLAVAMQESGAVIKRDGLPELVADASQLTQLFQNLIGNAIKFRAEGRAPEIAVSARREGAEWWFAVADNGIGIEPQYYERVFRVFQRLHTRSRYPGTGIGLAICKKIVERHGGRIWIESQPGAGTTFFFTLPDRPPASLS